MMDYYAIRVHYVDASALVKLIADDPDEEPGREIHNPETDLAPQGEISSPTAFANFACRSS